MKKVLLAISFVSLVFVSCKKDNDEPNDVTPTVQNVSGSYKMAKVTTKASGGAEQDVTTMFFDACERDDVYKFNTNLTYNYQDVGTVCSPDGSFDGTWDLLNTTTIDIDGSSATIVKFNGTNLNVSYDLGSGQSMIFYFVKQ